MTPAQLEKERLRYGLSAQEVANILGVHIRTVFKWQRGLNGRGTPSPIPEIVGVVFGLMRLPEARKLLLARAVPKKPGS
jgi:transcriptional regulator with XRE-family HTH domain